MRQADRVLDDEKLLTVVYEALVRRHPKSRTRGRLGVSAEIVVRMLLLKHIRNWSFDVVEREVRPNLLGLRRNLWVTFGHRTDHGPTDGADRVVRSITKPMSNERSERPFDRGYDANDPREARGAVGR
jgi:hypothetical protein